MPNPTGAKKILLVEDDSAMRTILARKLRLNNFEVFEAENGRQAIDLCLAQKPDLVLMDLMIPEIDGFAVLKTIRQQPDKKIAETPVIVLSNLYSNEDIVRAQTMKISGYFVKAYLTTEEILKEINTVLK